MDETSHYILDLLWADKKASWVYEQVAASFAEGIVESAKDIALSEQEGDNRKISEKAFKREKIRREKYETSRPYEETEKMSILKNALHEVFITIPEMQIAAINAFHSFGVAKAEIEFLAPNIEELAQTTPSHRIAIEQEVAQDLKRRFNQFCMLVNI